MVGRHYPLKTILGHHPALPDGSQSEQADQFGLHGLGGSLVQLVQLARVVAGLVDPVAQAINADAQFPGNMGHGNVRGRCQQDRLVAELREDGATYGRMIGVGRSTGNRSRGSVGNAIDGTCISGSWQVAGSRSSPKVWVPEREQCVDGRSGLLARPVWPVFGRLSTLWVLVQDAS